MKIATASQAPKVIFDHTQKEGPTIPHETRQTFLSAGNTTSNVQGPEDGSGLRGEGSTTSSDASDSQDKEIPADSHEEFMRTYGHRSVNDFDDYITDGYESAEKYEATSATASATSSPMTHIASTAQRSAIMSKTFDWESQKDFKPPEQEEWRDKVNLGKKYADHRPRVLELLRPFESMS